MRNRLEHIFNKLVSVAFYVAGVWILMALLGFVLDYQKEGLKIAIMAGSFIFLESLLMVMVALKYYDLRDAAKEKRWGEFLPFRATELAIMILYIILIVAAPLAVLGTIE